MAFEGIVDRFSSASSAFGQKLATVRPAQWSWPTPCTEWNVRQLVNHMAQGNLNYVRLLDGAPRAEFLRLRDADALGSDPPAPGLVAWASDHLDEIYDGLAETPADPQTTHRFFATPPGVAPASTSPQDWLLHRMGRRSSSEGQ